MAGMLRHALLAATLLLVACGRVLPSAEPLGSGPLAEPEGADEPSFDRTSPRSERPEPSARAAPELAIPDAGVEAGSADAVVAAAIPDAGADRDAAPSEALAFAGEYYGEDVSILRSPGKPDVSQRDPNARTRVEQPAKDRLTFVIVDSQRGIPLVSLGATLAGVDATLTTGQSWFEGGSVEGGKARFSGNRLVLDVDVEIPDEGDGAASVDYHFEGTRR